MLLKALILNHCTSALPTELISEYLVLVFFNLAKNMWQRQQPFMLQTHSLPTLGLTKKSNKRTFTPELADLDIMAADGHKNMK